MQTRTLQSHQSIREDQDGQQKSCQICNMGSEEVVCVLQHLMKQLKSVNLEQENQNIYECGGFIKLLKLIFHSKCKNFRDTMKCTHSKTTQFFLQNLKVSLTQLNRASNIKIVCLAKYNFHSDAISLQVKGFHRHFYKAQNKKQIKKIKRKQGTPEKTARTSYVEKKAEQQKQSQNKQIVIKQEHDFANNQGVKKNVEFMDYHPINTINGQFPYQLRFDGEFPQLMGNVMMINYGFHPLNQP